MKREKYRKGVFVVVYIKENDKIKYLILKRHKHWKGWEFIKGGCEKESELDCVKREIKEETGLKAFNIIKYNKKGKYKWKKGFEDRPGLIGQTFSLYSAEIKKRKIKIDNKEHLTYKFLDYKKALEMLTYSNQRSCLRIVNKNLV